MTAEKKQIHVNVPMSLHKEVMEILGEEKELSLLIRRLLRSYLKVYKANGGSLEDSAADLVVRTEG